MLRYERAQDRSASTRLAFFTWTAYFLRLARTNGPNKRQKTASKRQHGGTCSESLPTISYSLLTAQRRGNSQHTDRGCILNIFATVRGVKKRVLRVFGLIVRINLLEDIFYFNISKKLTCFNNNLICMY